ncbi:RDD family protein [Chitinophaga sancti]|uniref:RDD family protein n=1 Tax=Chitinophaga sancti TaxID=1004 RepID=UPI003F797727
MNVMPEGDILKDFDEKIVPPPVDRGVRFANFLIDYIMSYLFTILVCYSLVEASGGAIEMLNEQGAVTFTTSLLFWVIRPLYFVLMEGLTKGQTIGKLVTGSTAIRTDGAQLDWGNVFARSYSRIVPFEAWSGFAQTPWHDKWSNTTVVSKADLITR